MISDELLVIVVLFFLFCYLYYIRRQKVSTPLLSPGVVVRPVEDSAGHTLTNADDIDLLGVAPVQRVVPLEAKLDKVGFPVSPVMPDLNVIDGVAPYNPEISGNEWGATLISQGTQEGKTATSTYERNASAISMPAKPVVPVPKFVPVPTMVPAPKIVIEAKNESFDQVMSKGKEGYDMYNGYVNQPMLVNYKQPIDAVMSKWSQFGACSPVNNTKERTRTCIHDGIDGGKPCGHMIETIQC